MSYHDCGVSRRIKNMKVYNCKYQVTWSDSSEAPSTGRQISQYS